MEQTLSLLLKCKESDQEFTADEATDTINTLIHHDNTHCSKCPRISVYLLVGAYYFELFKMQLSKFKSLVIEKEFSATNSQDKENKNLDDIKIQNCHTFSGLINVDSQKLLLDNLISMIEVWQKLLGVKSLNPDLIGQLEVFEILRNSYFIFSFYGATKYSQLTGTIYLDLVLLHGQALKQHQLFANYCQIRLCLDCGLLEKARDYLKTSERLIKSAPENPANCLKRESYLIQIAECEWRLLSDENVEQAAADLNQLINEEYLRSNSTLSGYLRSLACFLLTKFSAKQFPSQNLVQCFHECHQFIRSVSCTWYPFLYELTPNDKRVNINSSLWLEFAVVKFTLEFSLTYNHYAANCWAGNSHFHFNILMIRLSRIYGSLLWWVQAILLRLFEYSNFELLTDFSLSLQVIPHHPTLHLPRKARGAKSEDRAGEKAVCPKEAQLQPNPVWQLGLQKDDPSTRPRNGRDERRLSGHAKRRVRELPEDYADLPAQEGDAEESDTQRRDRSDAKLRP